MIRTFGTDPHRQLWDAPLYYRWYQNVNPSGLGTLIVTNGTNNLTVPGAASEVRYYTCVASNTYGVATSAPILVTAPCNTVSGSRLTNGTVRLAFVGEAGVPYVLDRSFSLAPPAWIPQATGTVQFDGTLVFTNTPNQETNNFWRLRWSP